MERTRNRPARALVWLAILSLLLAVPAFPAAAQPEYAGWNGYTEPCGGDGGYAEQAFVSGPGRPLHGTGSVQFSIATVNEGRVWSLLFQRDVAGIALATLGELRYWTFVGRGGAVAPHLFLDVDLDGNGVADDRLIYQPELNGTVALLTWQEWDAVSGRWWSLRGLGGLRREAPGPLSTYLAAFPGARLAPPENRQGGLGIGAGCLGGGWAGWQGAVDALFVRAATLTALWNFEATGVEVTRGGGVTAGPLFHDLAPAPWRTVAPGTVTIGFTVTSDDGVRSVRLWLDDRELPVSPSGERTRKTVAVQRQLQPGFYVVRATATDELGRAFTTQWQFVLSTNPNDGWWFAADGTPRRAQIEASLRALGEAFRWHFFGLSWDGAFHPEMPTHADVAATLRFPLRSPLHFATLSPSTPIVISVEVVSTDQPLAQVELTLNGQPLPAVVTQRSPTHWIVATTRTLAPGTYGVTATARDTAGRTLTTVWGFVVSDDPNESPWFEPNGTMKAEVVARTLRTLVLGFDWHLYGHSWDGQPHPEFPTHASTVSGPRPLRQWFDSAGRPNRDAITAELRELEQTFRWHFWGISWDGQRHLEIPTHVE